MHKCQLLQRTTSNPLIHHKPLYLCDNIQMQEEWKELLHVVSFSEREVKWELLIKMAVWKGKGSSLRPLGVKELCVFSKANTSLPRDWTLNLRWNPLIHSSPEAMNWQLPAMSPEMSTLQYQKSKVLQAFLELCALPESNWWALQTNSDPGSSNPCLSP